MIRRCAPCALALALVVLVLAQAGTGQAASRGLAVVDAAGKKVGAFTGSYALLVGVSDYRAGWPKLESVPGELAKVKAALEANGFTVETVMDPDSRGLERAFKDFIDRYGYKRDHRLLFYFSGHGHTLDSGARGFLVPRDAPLPARDEEDFRRKALNMSLVMAWCRDMTARHALFLFDSCFSGTIFKTKALPEAPPHITAKTSEPVRQFITAGGAGETVPARSVFAPAFVDALAFGEGDLNHDGWVSGMELGLHLQARVPQFARQTPQFGTIDDYDLSRGDFVFRLADGTPEPPRPKAGKASLKVETEPAGAAVFVNGQRVGSSPVDVKDLASGTVTVRAEMAGNAPAEKTLEVSPGQSVYLPLTLMPLALMPQPRKARLTVAPTPADAEVKVLNISQRYSPGMELDPGRYHLKVSQSGYATFDRWVDLAPGQDLTVPVELRPEPQAPPPPPPLPGGKKAWTDPATGMEFVWVPAGCFQMGSNSGDDDEKPVHEVCVDGFWLGKHEVTQGQWSQVMGGNPSNFQKGDDYPVEQVSWNDAQEYIRKLSSQGNGRFRLPTEAEWEFAARSGGRSETYAGGEDVDRVAWYSSNSGGSTHRVGTKAPNGLGLYDMSGNVWEWCEDVYDRSAYSKHDHRDPLISGGGWYRVGRGGSGDNKPAYVRSADRSGGDPGRRSSYLGFRLLRVSAD